MSSEPPSEGQKKSLYRATTLAVGAFPELRGNTRADVAIIGAGITGLSAALHLVEQGSQAIVLEAHDIGWGASGRNGGQVNPGLKSDPGDLIKDFGERKGLKLIEAVGSAPAYLFDLVKRLDIDCAAANGGTIRVVRQPAEAEIIERSVRDWAKHGVALQRLDAAQLAALSGTDAYPCGLLDPRGGQVNPLAYTRGLADAASAKGARIFVGSPAVTMKREAGSWRITTPSGEVDAGHVVLATNGYTDGFWPKLRETVVPVFSAIAATDPLPEAIRQKILPGRQVLYESSWRVLYYRVDDQGRFLMGGPSGLRESADEASYEHLVRHARTLYPLLKSVPFRYFWNGQVAITKDHYPHFHEPAPGVIAALGYNGRGVAMGTVMGRLVSERIAGASAEELALPVTAIDPFPFHPFWKLAVTGRRLFGALRDRLQPTSR
jgi:glycine/D-amino acid oxidase-like deaminating enzyme